MLIKNKKIKRLGISLIFFSNYKGLFYSVQSNNKKKLFMTTQQLISFKYINIILL